MNIAILNESYLTDQHLEALKRLGTVTVYESTDTEEKAIERLNGVDLAIADCFICPLTRKVFEASTQLKFIGLNSTAYDLVDTVAAKERGISVSNIPGFSTEAVAEQVFALLLAIARKIPMGDAAMRRSPFQVDPSALQERGHYLGLNLRGKTLGVIGLGSIGQRVAEIGLAFGMKVLGYNRTLKELHGVQLVSLDELLAQSDVVSINLRLTSVTEGILSREKLSLMKPTSILINTARGKHVDEAALFEALSAGRIAGAGLDVLVDWSLQNPLLKLENVVLSPHSGFLTDESLKNAADIIVKNVEAFVAGAPINVVNF